MKHNLEITEETGNIIENLASLAYTTAEMAIYFDVDPIVFQSLAENKESKVYYHIKRGQTIGIANEEMALLDEVVTGKKKAEASKRLHEIRRNRSWDISKIDIFGGFEDSRSGRESFEKLKDYIESGSINKLSAEEAIYIEALTLFNSMTRKYGRRNTIRFFTGPPFNLKYTRASEMHDEAINLFYTDRNIEKKALRNLKADQLEEAAILARDMARSSKDLDVYGNLIMKAAKLQELDRPDIEKLPADVYMKPVRVYSLDTTHIGLPLINRQELAEQIEALEIPERDKMRLTQDALMAPFNIEDTLNGLEEESKH